MGLGQSNGPVLARGDVNIITNLCKKKQESLNVLLPGVKLNPMFFPKNQ
jgi:hypothetical protein